MLKKTKSINVNGSSVVTTDSGETVIMTMNATISETGTVSYSKYIQDKNVYAEHKDEAAADYEEFENYVDAMMEV